MLAALLLNTGHLMSPMTVYGSHLPSSPRALLSVACRACKDPRPRALKKTIIARRTCTHAHLAIWLDAGHEQHLRVPGDDDLA